MLLFPTVLVGSLFGYSFGGNFFGAIIAGLISYYLINLIPHWSPENFSRKDVVIIRYTDFVVSACYFSFLLFVVLATDGDFAFKSSFSQEIVIFNYLHFWGALAASSLFLFFYFVKNKSFENIVLKLFIEYSQKLAYTDRSLWGIFVQIAIVIVSLTILFSFIDFPSWQTIVNSLMQ